MLKLILSLSLLLMTSFSYARLPVEYATVKVNGEAVEFPIGNENRKNDTYYLKKAINGDKEALEMFLGGERQRYFFIGEYTPKWLIVDNTGSMLISEVGPE